MTVEVTVAQLQAAGKAAEDVARRVAAADAGKQVEALVPALPGGLGAGAAAVLADRWDARIGRLAASIDQHSIVLGAAARAYVERDTANAGSWVAPRW